MVIFYGFPVDCEQLMVMAVSVELLSFDWMFFLYFTAIGACFLRKLWFLRKLIRMEGKGEKFSFWSLLLPFGVSSVSLIFSLRRGCFDPGGYNL